MLNRTNHSRGRRGLSLLPLAWVLVCLAAAGILLAKGLAAPSATPEASIQKHTHTKAIEDVKAGDRVWAYDPRTAEWKAKEVLRPLVHDYTGDLVTVTVAGHSVEATGNHPFWVVGGEGLSQRPEPRDVPMLEQHLTGTKGRWVAARDLEVGDLLMLRNGNSAPIDMVTVRQASAKVYNIQVADLHTYAVGDLGIAVHNKCFPPGTLVLMGDGSAKAIEKVQLGEWVLAKDPSRSDSPTPARVDGIVRDSTDCLTHISFCSSDCCQETVIATRFHPFWTQNRGWVNAKDVTTNDLLEDCDGKSLSVTSISSERRYSASFNLSVRGIHAYYVVVGQHSVLVHNTPILNFGGEGEVSGNIVNVQGPGALQPGWGSAGNGSGGVLGAGTNTVVQPNLTIGQIQAASGQPVVIADPYNLPFADNSVPGAITNGAPIDTPPNVVYGPSIQSSEVQRVLQPGGQWLENGVVRFTKPSS